MTAEFAHLARLELPPLCAVTSGGVVYLVGLANKPTHFMKLRLVLLSLRGWNKFVLA